jgi:NADPH-dependent 2,4-dienoyl-CoA reductase/sulfur reductase-like enzyme
MKHVIIGNGPAGVVAAETLRKLDPAGGVTLIGDEPEPPYSRMALPYLMTGKIGEAGTYLRKDPNHYAAHRIDLVQGRVDRVDTASRTLELAEGARRITYDRLLIATGVRRARRFRGSICRASTSAGRWPTCEACLPMRGPARVYCSSARVSSVASSWSHSSSVA